jgi:hypothetical protein
MAEMLVTLVALGQAPPVGGWAARCLIGAGWRKAMGAWALRGSGGTTRGLLGSSAAMVDHSKSVVS